MTDAAERAADAEQAEVEALNWQAEQQRTQDAMRAVFAAVLAEIDAEVQVYTPTALSAASDEPEYEYGCRDGCERCRSIVIRHAAAAGVEMGA